MDTLTVSPEVARAASSQRTEAQPKEWVEDVDSEPGLIGAPGARCTAFEPDPSP